MGFIARLVWGMFLSMMPEVAWTREPVGQNLILLLVDGFGASLLNQTKPESVFGLRQLIDNGVQAEYLEPVYPTQHWPNWFSLTTGLYTESHGFTADYIWDNKTGNSFRRGSGDNDTDDIWWEGRPAPFWHTAGKSNVDVHCYWFAHCHRAHVDAIVQVPHKRIANLDDPQQTDGLSSHFGAILARIAKYQPYKQQLYLLRYAGVGQALTQYGVNSEQTEAAIAKLDLHVHELQQKLEDQGLLPSTNLVVMSDFGLASVDEEEKFFLEECISDYSKVQYVVNTDAMSLVYTTQEDAQGVYFELRICDQWQSIGGDYDEAESQQPPVSVYQREHLPESWHFRDSRFMPHIIVATRPGVTIATRELPSIPAPAELVAELHAAGGWDPKSDAMKGIFLARGPAFKQDEKVGPINIVDVYQVVLNILGIEPPHTHNGTWHHVEAMMSDGWEERPVAEKPNLGARMEFSAVTLAMAALLVLRGL